VLEVAWILGGAREVAEIAEKLIMTVLLIAKHGHVLNRVVHPLDLPIGPGMIWLR
jgi:hypothetical protein